MASHASVELTHDRIKRDTVGHAVKAIGMGVIDSKSVGDQQVAVLIANPSYDGSFAEENPGVLRGLVFTQEMARGRAVTAEVEELQWTAIDLIELPVEVQVAVVEVPVGHIAGRVSKYFAIEHSGNEVDPPLIDESHVTGVDDTLPE